MRITPRLAAKLAEDFGEDADDVWDLINSMLGEDSEDEGSERIIAAVIISAHGDTDALVVAIDEGVRDWRDLLCTAGLEQSDWRERLDELFGPTRRDVPGPLVPPL